jgi:hypothetical protein
MNMYDYKMCFCGMRLETARITRHESSVGRLAPDETIRSYYHSLLNFRWQLAKMDRFEKDKMPKQPLWLLIIVWKVSRFLQ